MGEEIAFSGAQSTAFWRSESSPIVEMVLANGDNKKVVRNLKRELRDALASKPRSAQHGVILPLCNC
jgi:chaperonin GroEL (HSP60 family)